MAITTNTFWMNPQSNSLVANYGSNTNAKVPIFNQGDIESIDLHLVQIASSGATYEVPFPAGCSIQVAVGLVNELPTAGTWRLKVSGTETADLDYNATASQITVALNAISAVSTEGGVTVSTLGDSFLIAWNTVGVKPDIEAGSDTLTPASYESLQVGQVGDATNKQTVILTLRQSPVAIGTEWTPITNPVTSISLIQAWNGTQVIYRIDTNPLAKTGSLLLTFNGEQTVPIDINSPSGNYSVSLQDLVGIGSGKVNVSQSGEQTFDIAIQITPTTGLTVDYSGLIGFSGYSGLLNFSTAEVHALLQGNDSVQCSVEVRVTTDSQPQTVLLAPCFVISDMVSDGAIAPVSFGTPLTEEVANARFVRRDTNQAPDAPTQDIIWQNLGVTEDGSDVAAAISNANSPSGANPIATMADVGGGGGSFNGGAIDNPITIAGTSIDSEMSSDFFGVELSSDNTQFTEIEYNKLTVNQPGYNVTVEPNLLKVWETTNNLGVSIAHDSIAIQHIDTPNVTGYFTNEYIGFEDLGGSPHSAFIEHDVITVQNESINTQMRATGVIVTYTGVSTTTIDAAYVSSNTIYAGSGSQTTINGTGITFPDTTVQTTAYIPGAGQWNQFDTMTMLVENPTAYISSGYSSVTAYFTQGSNPISYWYNNKYATAYWGLFINGTLIDTFAYATTYYYAGNSTAYTINTGDHLQVKLGWFDGSSYTWASTAFILDQIY
jgi:hypothetical protein